MKEAIRRTKKFLEVHGLSISAFARENRLDVSEVAKVLRGERTRMSIEMAARIEIATDGYVLMSMWINDKKLYNEYMRKRGDSDDNSNNKWKESSPAT